MTRLFSFVAVVVLFLSAAGAAMAQNESMIGNWKLNVAKSNFVNLTPPKNETRTVEAQGKDLKISFEGTAVDGSRIAYTITAGFDGKDRPITGSGQANGADSLSVIRVNATTTKWTLKRAGKVVQTSTTVVSKDGKTTTVTMKGMNTSGKPTSFTMVWEKQ